MDFLGNVDWQELLQTYGYWAILLGTFLEGETIVILAGICVAGGQLSFEGVAASAFIGSSLSDQLTFSLGKYKGRALLARFPKLNRKKDRVARLLLKYDTFLILGFRFVYGIRNVTPIVLGLSHISHWRFLALNLTGALVWAVSFTAGGYYFGAAIEHMFKMFGVSIFCVIAGILLVVAGVVLFAKRRKVKRLAEIRAAREKKAACKAKK